MSTRPRKPQVRPRKSPTQARSREMDAAILDAAEKVLGQSGAVGFTTNKVAEAAGISVGSLYQYYPNKAAILFRVHTRETESTLRMLRETYATAGVSYEDRFRTAVRRFFESEFAERHLRQALSDAQPLFRNAPEFQEAQAQAAAITAAFLGEWLRLSGRPLAECTELVLLTVTSVAEAVTNRGDDPRRVRWWASEVTAMLLARLKQYARDSH